MNTYSTKKNMPHSTISKVIRFGSELFSPLIPPVTTLNNTTTAINPQDVILNPETVLSLYTSTSEKLDYQPSPTLMSLKTRGNEIPFGNAIAIGPAGYIETVRSPYSNFGDIFFDVTTPDSGFSIECKDNDSSICNNNPGQKNEPFTPNNFTVRSNSFHEEFVLPPSSAILQSQLDNSSLDYFISNNSFLEEIKNSLSFEQQQYINSGMTTATNPCTTMSPSTGSDDTPNYSERINLLQPDVTYDEIFENGTSEDDSDNCFSILISPSSNYCSMDEDDDDITVKSEGMGEVDTDPESTLNDLLRELTDFNNTRNTCASNHLENIKNKYISQINDAYIYNNTLTTIKNISDCKIGSLYFAIIKAYREANSKADLPHSNNVDQVKLENVSTKKRRIDDDKEFSLVDRKRSKKKVYKKENKDTHSNQIPNKPNDEVKKSRKNYNADTIDILMDWYLENDGKPPSNESKQHLSVLTGKTDIQISTWFQNARRRYQKKLENFQSLHSIHPNLVYDNQSLKRYMKANKY